jgi:hypothetical protein
MDKASHWLIRVSLFVLPLLGCASSGDDIEATQFAVSTSGSSGSPSAPTSAARGHSIVERAVDIACGD